MGFEKLVSLECETTHRLGGVDKKTGKKNPSRIEGYYIGTRQVPSPKSKTGLAALHIFQTPNGNEGVWGKTNLDAQMGGVEPGTMTRITFVGMVPTKNNPMFKYSVEVDKSNTIDVAAAAESTEEAEDASEGYDGAQDADFTGGDEEESAVDEIQPERPQPPRRAAPPPAANVSKVQALLNKNRATA